MNRLGFSEWATLACGPRWVRIALLLGLMALVMLGGYFYRVNDLRLALAREQAVASDLREREAQAGIRLQRLADEQHALHAAQEQLRDIRWRLAGGEDVSDLVDQLAMAGHEYGLSFTQIGVTPHPPAADHRRVSLELNVRGTYPGVRNWLDGWLAQVRVLHVREATLTRSTTLEGPVHARLVVDTYHPGEAIAAPRSLAHEPAHGTFRRATHDLFAPWTTQHTGTDLGQMPLEQVEMVGSLLQGGRRQAVLASAGRLYRVSLGDRLGRNEGRVVALEEHRLVVRKRLYIGDTWQERSRTLPLRRVAGQWSRNDGEDKDVLGAGKSVDDGWLAAGGG